MFPVKIVLRVAASLIMNRDEQRKLGEDEVTYDSLELQELREECLKVATYAKARFELMDRKSETEFGERLSVGLPDFSGKKSKKQKERFVSQFVGSVKKKGKGLPFDLGLLSINSDGDVEFTDWGVHFMLLDNPIIDEINIEAWKSGDSFSDEEKSYLIKMIEKLNPGEFDFMTKITEWIKDGKNFSEVIPTGGLIKPTSMAGDYGHLGYQPLAFAPNQTYKDFTCDFEKTA